MPTVSGISPSNNMHTSRHKTAKGFTLLEVLVALVIVGTALGASLRAVGSLTQNSSGLRASMMATCRQKIGLRKFAWDMTGQN